MAVANQVLVERLFLAQKDALWRYFVRRVRRRSDAEELAQEVYLRLLRVADADALRNPEAYLYAIAANLLKEHAVQQSIGRNCVSLEDAGFPESTAHRALAGGAAATARQVPSRSSHAALAWAELRRDRTEARHLRQHGEEVSGSCACALPASHAQLEVIQDR
jgi:DNA-directed RNA polymerase specialized sigma24 family protein